MALYTGVEEVAYWFAGEGEGREGERGRGRERESMVYKGIQ